MTKPTLSDIIDLRLSRRDLLKTGAALGATSLLPFGTRALSVETKPPSSSLTFQEIAKSFTTTHQIAKGYHANVLIRWGDKVYADAPEFMPHWLSGQAQARQFGYNNDYIAYLPLPLGSRNSSHGLLFVNHEYTNAYLMFTGLENEEQALEINLDRDRVLQEAHGFSVVEIKKQDGKFTVVAESNYNRRVSTTTPIRISGPAAGHKRLQTTADPTGKLVLGTLGNCAGGTTPWGTVLTAEENIDGFFMGKSFAEAEDRNHTRFGIGKNKRYYGWGRFDTRFDAEKEPNEPNRFGWIVEHDPYDPDFVPVKRTALGRFKHESANTLVAKDGRIVVYSGDDEMLEYVYRFISKGRYQPKNRDANLDLLDEGILYAARFDADGTMTWLPLEYGKAPLNEENGFYSQADVLIEARTAAELMGATPMDRPEDIDIEPEGGRVYVALTKNKKREKANVANRRKFNIHGHIIELTPPDGDHTSDTFRWEIFLEGGNPQVPEDLAMYLTPVSENGWLSCPDNLAFDPSGRLWISTDGQPDSIKKSDGLYACDTSGEARGMTKLFFCGPRGAEIAGPCFTPDGKTLFLSVQHPGEDKGFNFDNPSTRWPDFDADKPPRPSVLVITKDDGGEIGS